MSSTCVLDRNSQTEAHATATTPSGAPRTARPQRVREEMTAEILAVAREHLAKEGAAALSLRSVARDLELAPSALYRYFDGRDALLSALIMTAYESLATEADTRRRPRRSGAGAVTPSAGSSCPARHAALGLGTPARVGAHLRHPGAGYQAPEDTVEPYTRVASALVRPLIEAKAAGRLARTAPRASSTRRYAAVAPVGEGLFTDMPVDKVVQVVQAWSTVVGVISLEVFGHWRNTILDPEAFFDATIRDIAQAIGLS